MKTYFKIIAALLLLSGTIVSCRDTNPADPDHNMVMTTDSIFTKNDSINNNYSTEGADTELDGE